MRTGSHVARRRYKSTSASPSGTTMRFPAALANAQISQILTGDTANGVGQIDGVPNVVPTSGAAIIAAARKTRQRVRFVSHGSPGFRRRTIAAATSASLALATKYCAV